MRKIIFYILFILGGLFGMASCKKDKTLTSGGSLTFSVDTLKFDTVFTAAGSFTRSFTIHNPQNEAIELSSVYVKKGGSSFFHINVDGIAGNTVSNVKIAAHDSAYVFATVNINPTDTTNPFLISDSIVAVLNGQSFNLPLTAYGQNAHYIVGSFVGTRGETVNWLKDKPYVIIHSAAVDTEATLNIPPGCRIYMNADSRLVVSPLATLHINGTKTDTVVFQGDRLDRSYFGYEGYPGEWGGIYFDSSSTGNTISYTRLLNCGNTALGALPGAIQVMSDPDAIAGNIPSIPQLKIDHSIIQNSIGYGIINWQGSVVVTNCLINTTGAEAFLMFQGGYSLITDCTFANYGSDNVSHANNGTLALTNFYSPSQGVYYLGNMNAIIRNCIIWGSLDSEVVCDTISGTNASVTFDHCLMKSKTVPAFVSVNSCITNQDPQFNNTAKFDFHLMANSPAISAGVSVAEIMDDLDGYPRSTNDIGCYQHH